MQRTFRFLVLVGVICVFSTQADSADLDYQGNTGYNPWTCIELAQEEAQAIIELAYLYPRLTRDDADAELEKHDIKQRKRALHREQRQRECI